MLCANPTAASARAPRSSRMTPSDSSESLPRKLSVSLSTRSIASMAAEGCCPIDVSPESIVASALVVAAWAMSVTSARVGMGWRIMLSSMCVATMTGFPASRHVRTMSSCTTGIRSKGISAPRSPRAIMMPSATRTISVSALMACCVSILAMTSSFALCLRIAFFTACTSSALRTKESATKSTPSAMAKAMSSQSF